MTQSLAGDDKRARLGIALFAALALMTILGLMVGGALATSRLAEQSARASHADAELTAAAELGLHTVVADADARGLADLPLGRALSYKNVSLDPAFDVTVVATRLPAGVVWLVSESRRGATKGARRVNLIARWQLPGEPPAAALVARGSVHVGVGVTVVTDTTGDADCRAAADAPLIVVGPGAAATGGGVDSGRISTRESAADSTTYYLAPWQRARFDSAAGVVVVTGDTTIVDGTLDGILIVDGDLTILGSLAATGLIIARGVVDVATGSINLSGAMLSFATPTADGNSIDVRHGMIRYSPCVVAHAWRRSLALRPVRHRSWAELF